MFLSAFNRQKTVMPSPDTALPGRSDPIPTAERHFVNGRALAPPYPDGMKEVQLGMGCFWGAERLLWQTPGVYVTAAGYAGGITPNPTYEETCTGLTGHAEVVRVIYDPAEVGLERLLRLFFEAHDPTQGMRQGNDIGTTYRSAIYLENADDLRLAETMRDRFQQALQDNGRNDVITTEIAPAGAFYMAEDYHQQYLAKNPAGYCGLKGTGVSCPAG
ncbi:peptide-methionine (S)-S-oxide reductase MsrA [Martelella lutilitoris]|uniref:Peptide methionine sulfoxide reductase MsrA n=1 Tax=Martelella lutilitoris TaxID=2583532 RepID=A0A5C4JV97_9HYPH|nr:peptide-methionine (S)-S-oxide reductase MsrA [Martelella lutilitoris]TNB48569.1 peptide-methionine (S)-S-oxide reductase MsrA [Martelella lutilitoris]